MAMEKLEDILVPFMLAVAISYLLSPIIEWLVKLRVPRALAMLFAFCVAIAILATVGLIVIRAVANFTQRKDAYQERVEELLESAFDFANALSSRVYGKAEGVFHFHSNHTALQEASEMVNALVAKVSVTEQIMGLLGTAAHAAEEAMYITLFLIFLLHKHEEEGSDDNRQDVGSKVNRQIMKYISGKCGISFFVGFMHALVLGSVGLEDMWLSFGVVTFFLNFIPNIGGFTAVLLPMPLLLLDSKFGFGNQLVAFIIPCLVNIFAKDYLEPTILGGATSLQPVVVLLSILLFGSVWDVTGMVMAIPITAVLRIYLESIDHPIPQFVARLLSGKKPRDPSKELV